MDHKWKQLILEVNFLCGFRVNEIPNETFILDSHYDMLKKDSYKWRPFVVFFHKFALFFIFPQLQKLASVSKDVKFIFNHFLKIN
jgi:hypothetical protein